MTSFMILVHAPVLGPASWRPVATELTRAGHQVVVPSLTGFADGGPPYAPRLIRLAAAQIPAGPRQDVVLVVHSGAGVFAAHLAAAAAAPELTVVFADASLPRQAAPALVLDPGFRPVVGGLASDGVVAPWHQWWPEEELAPLFPDLATRREVTAEARSVPLAFFEETLPPLPDGWPPCRAAYLAFSEPYRREAELAAHGGWPVRELAGGHLHMLVDPGGVAAEITSLAAQARSTQAGLRSLP
jgi:hypothetical protein